MTKCASVPDHSKYSCSALERIEACPGCVQASEGLPRQESSYALEGKDAHFCLEQFIKAGMHKRLSIEHFLRKKYPLQMVVHAAWAYDQIVKRTPRGAAVFSEQKVMLDWIHPEFGGTLDASIVEEFGHLDINDLKYGRGMVVEPGGPKGANLQLASYAVAVIHKYDYNFATVDLVVLQPRIPHPGGLIRSYRLSMNDVQKYEDRFKRIIDAAEKKNPRRCAGEHCRFCTANPRYDDTGKSKDYCSEALNAKLREAQNDFENLDLDDDQNFLDDQMFQ